mgnify:CR=1 FL=1
MPDVSDADLVREARQHLDAIRFAVPKNLRRTASKLDMALMELEERVTRRILGLVPAQGPPPADAPR